MAPESLIGLFEAYRVPILALIRAELLGLPLLTLYAFAFFEAFETAVVVSGPPICLADVIDCDAESKSTVKLCPSRNCKVPLYSIVRLFGMLSLCW